MNDLYLCTNSTGGDTIPRPDLPSITKLMEEFALSVSRDQHRIAEACFLTPAKDLTDEQKYALFFVAGLLPGLCVESVYGAVKDRSGGGFDLCVRQNDGSLLRASLTIEFKRIKE